MSPRREILPPELAALVDFPERPRSGDWSLRAALTRYAQPEPVRVGLLLESVRRTEAALGSHTAELRSDGPDLWAALESGDVSSPLLGLLAVARRLDEVGDSLAAWAVAREGERPDALVDEITAETAARLDELGVRREEGPPPPGARRRG